jgi:tetratricopeptide (TPR) repeat protein
MDLPFWTGSASAAQGSLQRRQIARHFGIEYENWRAALEWIEAEPNSNDQQLLLAASMLAVTMGPGAARGRIGELRQIVTAALARSDPAAQTLPRARALVAAVMLAGMQGDPLALSLAEESIPMLRALGLQGEQAYVLMMIVRFALPDLDAARRAMDESRALFEENNARWGIGQLLSIMGDTELRSGDYDAARGRYTESLALTRQLGELTLSTMPLAGLSQIACIDGDYARARALVEEALAIRRQPDYGYPWTVANALVNLGEVERCAGDPSRGVASFEQALATGRELADDVLVGYSLHNLGHVALFTGDLSTAAARFHESLQLRWRLGPGDEVAASLAGLAGVALREGQLTEALRLFGAVDRMLLSTHHVLRPADEQVRRKDLATIHSRMDDRAFDVAFHEGQAATFDELEAIAGPESLPQSRGGI